MKFRYITPLLVAAGAAAAIIAAPTAMAANTTDQCSAVPGVVDSVCVTPGNAQLNDSAPVQFGPQYPYWGGRLLGWLRPRLRARPPLTIDAWAPRPGPRCGLH